MEAEQEPVFEIKKWNAVALWAWGKRLFKLRCSH
jgi:hypothetical protein